MYLTCPSCGKVNEVPELLIPSATLKATCSQCGAKIVSRVPARLQERRAGRRRGSEVKRRGEASAAKKSSPEEQSQGRPAHDARRADAGPTEAKLGALAKGLTPERLAGLIASDLLLYNRDKIARSSAEGRLLSALAPDIVEAWEFYKKRVGVQIALGTSYFRDAINKLSPDGEPLL